MATIQFKRGKSSSTSIPAAPAAGEPIFLTDTGKLYIGTGDTNNPKILINPDMPDSCTAGTYAKVTVDAKGRVTDGSTLAVADIPTLPSSKITGLGTAAALNTGTKYGNIPVLDSNDQIPISFLPSLAITDTFVVSSQSAMLGLTAQRGDVAIRTDLSKTFILAKEGAGTLENWVALATPSDAVSSVNGSTGAVTITLASLGGAPSASPALSGTPTAPTPSTDTNSTQIATTAYVKAQGYLTPASSIDGGTF